MNNLCIMNQTNILNNGFQQNQNQPEQQSQQVITVSGSLKNKKSKSFNKLNVFNASTRFEGNTADYLDQSIDFSGSIIERGLQFTEEEEEINQFEGENIELSQKSSQSSTSPSFFSSIERKYSNNYSTTSYQNELEQNGEEIRDFKCCSQCNYELKQGQCQCSQLSEEEAMQPLLQQQLKLILQTGLSVGLYENENKDQWKLFVSNLQEHFAERATSRSKVEDYFLSVMQQNNEELTDLLKDLGLEYGKTSIKEIISKINSYFPCSASRELEASEALYIKNEQNLNELKIEGSKVRLSILQGLKKSGKYTSSNELEQRILKIIEGRIQDLQKLKKKIESLRNKMEADVKYIRLQRLQCLLKECFQRWEEADQNAGKETQKNGQKLEDFMREENNQYMNIILKRLGLKPSSINIHYNLLWEGGEGEVDITITDCNNENILGLVEIKSRLYDIAAAYRQSGPQRIKSKMALIVQNKLLEVPFDAPVFVVTAIPSYSFQLEFESKLKDSLNKFFAITEPHLVDYEEVYRTIKPVYKNLYSPLEWFNLYASDYLIIIDQQSQSEQVNQVKQNNRPLLNKQNIHDLQKRVKNLQNDNSVDHSMSVDTDDDDTRGSLDWCLQLRDQEILESFSQYSPILSSQSSCQKLSDCDEDFCDEDNQSTATSLENQNEDIKQSNSFKKGEMKLFQLFFQTIQAP